MPNSLVVVKINKTYRASVYDVEDLKRYVESHPKDIDYSVLEVEETFRHVQNNSVKTIDGYAEHLAQVKAYVASLHDANVVQVRRCLLTGTKPREWLQMELFT